MIALDTSVIVASHAGWHDRHEAAAAAVARALSRGAIVPAHAVLEAYSVLTRLPERFRTSPSAAAEALRASLSSATIAPFPARAIWSFIDHLGSADLHGGIIYDAAILKTAEDAGASMLLTLNRRHFERLNPHIRIEEP